MVDSKLAHKKEIVEEIKEAVQNAKSITIVDYRGLNVSEVTDLRNKYRETNTNYKVYKNTLMNIALQELGYEGYEEYLKGPNGFVFSNEDMVSGPKVSVDFSKGNDKLVVKAGFMDGKVLDADEIKALAKLPTKDVLIAMALGGLNAPITGFVNVLQGTIRKLVYALDAIREKEEETAA